jgi:hypothetical protein
MLAEVGRRLEQLLVEKLLELLLDLVRGCPGGPFHLDSLS